MRRSLVLVAALVAACIVLSATLATAGGEERRRGSCSGGPGHWTLRVKREDRDRLRVRFEVDDIAAGQVWHLFLSDNGSRIASATKTSTRDGEVRIRTVTRDRAGRDRIAASGVNTRAGTTCEGSLRY